jgi:lipoprotein-anchoring transpeptidase ErfK/SrfK
MQDQSILKMQILAVNTELVMRTMSEFTKEMIARVPEKAKWANGMPGGPDNPLGARALYLFQNGQDTLYRIHGTTDPMSIGHNASSGCIRMVNQDVIDLYGRVAAGATVKVI